MTNSIFEQLKNKWLGIIDKKQLKDRKALFQTSSGLDIAPFYLPKNQESATYEQSLNVPGQFPYTRGVQPTMYRGRFWTMRQYAGFGNAAQSNQRYQKLIQGGGTGLSVAFDLPTQMGIDSDNKRALGEVGKTGVAIDSLKDMETLFNGIDLATVSTSMTINSTAAIVLAMYLAVAQKQGADLAKIKGTIQNDLLKEYVARGTYIYPVTASMRLITDIFSFCKETTPLFNTISISGYHIREAGSTAVQEVAFTLANALAYVQAAIDAGLAVDSFAPRLSFFFNAHNNLFEEAAKFRAARRLWATLMKERFNASDRSCQMRFHTQTAGCTLTAKQPDNNIVRVAYQALSAVLGGTQSLHTNSRDEALALPTEKSVNIALRTQQILAEETGVADTIDPLAGSYFVEDLTNKIEEQALAYIEKIDGLGGAVKAIEQGFMQNEIQNAAYTYQKAIESKDQIIVGVNAYETEEPLPSDLLKIDKELETKQIKELTQLKNKRDNDGVTKHLDTIRETAKTTNNLMPPILKAVKAYATLGEISDVLRDVFGEYRE
ncbi:MAG: methylmalonyl-CoA mutase family protein [bacterium]|nr:methylmalonyl-CoA mutase family protein [bacterium]MBU1919113.1 methylmalonyl-CoA mutase family protein [bacterium]